MSDKNIEVKKQRVLKNNGKRFEEDIKASFSKEIWAYRPPDSGGGQMARFTQESICDLMAYNTKSKKFVLMELKSTLGTSVNFKPYEQCMEYERVKKQFDDWNAKLTAKTRKPIKDEIQETRALIRGMYKETNQAMIKYHQINNLLETNDKYGIDSYILFTFFKTTRTYAVPIKSFVEDFWKVTDKKSINETDIEQLISEGKAYNIPHEYIGRSMKSEYDVDFLTK